MIYLIGGAPRVGKSIAAKKLAKKLKARLVSTDELCEHYSQTISEAERKEKFPFPGFSGNPAENKSAPEELVNFQLVEARSLEQEIHLMVSAASSNNETLVIEGVHLLPESIRNLVNESGVEIISAVFVGSKDAERVAEGIAKNSSPNNWMRNSNPAVIMQVAGFAAAFSVWIERECRKFGLPYVERTDDFEADIDRAVDYLTQDKDETRRSD